MTTEAASVLLAVIIGVELGVWLIGLRFVLASRPRESTADMQLIVPEDGADRWPGDWLLGDVEVEGEPQTLARKAASLLVKESGALGPVKVVECADDRVRFERVGWSGGHWSQRIWFRRGEFRFAPLGRNRTRVEFAVERSAPRGLLLGAAIVQVVGLAALAAGSWLIYTFVVSSPEPAVRWQTLQMIQAVHFLWPPFLLAGLYRRARGEVRARFEALTNNLPYHAA
jgi:hypothetical protein